MTLATSLIRLWWIAKANPPYVLVTKEGILEFIKQCGYEKLFQGVGIDELQHPLRTSPLPIHQVGRAKAHPLN